MTLNINSHRWDGLFHRPSTRHTAEEAAMLHAGKRILVTGAGGSIGSALAHALHGLNPGSLVLLDSSEQNLFRIHAQLSSLPGSESHIPILASVADERSLRDIFERYQPEVIYHAAAFKHVPLMERNPFAVVQNNVFGTLTLARTARCLRAARLVMISTDKAVNPRSMMGASKRLAELALLMLGAEATRMCSIRLGNVLGSEGSVVPLFLEQIQRGGPLTVTHPKVERYFLTMEDALRCILSAASLCPDHGAICLPEMGEPIKIVDLARYLIQQVSQGDIPVVYTGLRPGDKLREEFVSDCETLSPQLSHGLHRVNGPRLSDTELAAGLAELNAALGELDLARLLAAVMRLVPEYQPSPYLRDQVALTAAT